MSTAVMMTALLLAAAPPQSRYALLVVGHVSLPVSQQGEEEIDADFQNDLLAQYAMLGKLGFQPSNIFVLYGVCGCMQISQYVQENCHDATPHNVKWALEQIGKATPAPSYLYMWWMSHGLLLPAYKGCTTGLMLEGRRPLDYDTVLGSDLAEWLGDVNAPRIDFFLEACNGEGAVRFLNNNKNVIAITDSRCDGRDSADTDPKPSCDGHHHGEFDNWLTAAILGNTKCESPKYPVLTEGRLSLDAIKNYASSRMIHSCPWMSDPKGAAPTTYLDLLGPSALQTVFDRFLSFDGSFPQ